MNTIEFKLISNLPEILNEHEIISNFKDYQQGNLKAREILIERNLRLVKYLIYKNYSEVPYDKEELFSIDIIGLIKAIDSYKTDKLIKFTTYASKCINNEILMYLRKNNNQLNHISMETSIIQTFENDEIYIKNIIKDDSKDIVEEYEKKEEYEIVRNIVNSLPDNDKLIIMLYFGFIDDKRLTQRQISKITGIEQSLISRKIKKIITTISNELKNYDYVIKNKQTKSKKSDK